MTPMPKVSMVQDDLKTARRRSMLPQLSHNKSSSRIPSPTKTSSTTTLKVKRDDANTHAKAAPTNVTTRLQTNANPKSSMGPPSKPARLQSSRDAPEAPANGRLSTTISLRRSSTVMSSSSVPVQSLPQMKKRTSSVTKTPSATPKIPSHIRSTSHQVTSISQTTATSASQESTDKRRASLRLKNPAFTAHQKHYTPSKPVPQRKPPLSKTKTPSSGPSTPDLDLTSDNNKPNASTPLTSAQMTELLYLHLLHAPAAPTLSAWQKSARQHFSTRFSDLHTRHVEIAAVAQEQQGLLNAIALAEWGAGTPSAAIGERVASLSKNIAELEGMVGAEGRFEKVRGTWEVWFGMAERVREVRKEEKLVEEGKIESVDFVEGIGDGWKAEAMVLERELGYVERELSEFGDARAGSGLGTLLRLGKRLVRGMLEELDVMQWIEDEVMKEEGAWVEEMIGELGKGVSDGMVV